MDPQWIESLLPTSGPPDQYGRHAQSPRRINHKATKSKTNTGTTALERSVEQTTGGGGGGGGVKALLQLANFTLGPDATLNTETHKNFDPQKGSQLSQWASQSPISHGTSIIQGKESLIATKWPKGPSFYIVSFEIIYIYIHIYTYIYIYI